MPTITKHELATQNAELRASLSEALATIEALHARIDELKSPVLPAPAAQEAQRLISRARSGRDPMRIAYYEYIDRCRAQARSRNTKVVSYKEFDDWFDAVVAAAQASV